MVLRKLCPKKASQNDPKIEPPKHRRSGGGSDEKGVPQIHVLILIFKHFLRKTACYGAIFDWVFKRLAGRFGKLFFEMLLAKTMFLVGLCSLARSG